MKILFITPRIPYPINKGDKLRAYHFLRLLKKESEIILFSLDYENTVIDHKLLEEICDQFFFEKISILRILFNLFIAPFRKIPFQVSFFYSPRIKIKLNKIIEEYKPDIMVTQLIRTAEYIVDNSTIPKILDYIDAISEGLKRRKEESNIFVKFFLNIEYKRVKNYEKEIAKNFDKKIIITEHEKQYLPVENKDTIYVIPNGVDSEYFKPSIVEKEYDLLFIGNLEYIPNILAAKFITNEILPMLKIKYPHLKVLIAGANPSKKVLSLSSPNVKILGWVDDIREYYSKSKIFIAPLFIGTGLQNKLLEAMSMEMPSIVSDLVQNGICASKDNSIKIARSSMEFVTEITFLLSNPDIARDIGKKAREFVIKYYNWNIVEQKLKNIILNEQDYRKNINPFN